MKSASNPTEYQAEEATAATTLVEWTTADMAAHWGVTARSVNLWRTEAERRAGRKLGIKRGKKFYYDRAEVEAIAAARSIDNETARARNAEAENNGAQKVYQAQADAEEQTIDGMEGLIAHGDKQAIELGQKLGQRWNALTMAAAAQTMAAGMQDLSIVMEGMQLSLNASLASYELPALPAPKGLNPND
jgi:hypothetical protein